MKDVVPRDTLELILARWYVLTCLLILGGLAGWLVSLTKTPVYEARASLVIYWTPYASGGRVSDSTSSWMLSAISESIAPHTLGAELVAEYGTTCQGITMRDLQIERREGVWDLMVRCSDPQGAADLANAWLEAAHARLTAAYEQSLLLEELDTTLGLLKSCKTWPTQPVCSEFQEAQDLQDRIQSLQEEIRRAQQASQGISPNLAFKIGSYAEVPSTPARYGTGMLILAGMAIGAVIAAAGMPALLRRRNRKQA